MRSECGSMRLGNGRESRRSKARERNSTPQYTTTGQTHRGVLLQIFSKYLTRVTFPDLTSYTTHPTPLPDTLTTTPPRQNRPCSSLPVTTRSHTCITVHGAQQRPQGRDATCAGLGAQHYPTPTISSHDGTPTSHDKHSVARRVSAWLCRDICRPACATVICTPPTVKTVRTRHMVVHYSTYTVSDTTCASLRAPHPWTEIRGLQRNKHLFDRHSHSSHHAIIRCQSSCSTT